ncbi:MAG: IS66 family transposase [Pseudomonadota bacterium]
MSPELWERIPPEAQVIFLEMAQTIKRLEARVAELERRAGMTPQNSSLPPSSQHPHARPAPKPNSSGQGRKPGGQPGHTKHERALVSPERVHKTVILKPDACRRCGTRLRGSDPDPLRHQVWELPEIQPTITEYQRHRLTCACGTTTCASLPRDVPTGQSGPRLVALVTLLMAHFRQSKRRVSLFCESVLNTPCSPGLVVKLQHIGAQAVAPCYDELAAALPQAEAVNLDETGTKQGPHKGWIWVAATAAYTLFAIRLTRSAQVARELLGAAFRGVITTDRYGGYNDYRRRQVCWAHLLRDFQALIDAGGAGKRIGLRLREVARELFGHWQRVRDGTITRETMRRHIHRLKYPLWEILEDGQRCRHAPTAALCRDLFERFDQLWLFLEHSDVEPTNNAAERALRHAVIWRKLSFGTKSAGGSRFVERLLSVIETCRQQDRAVLPFVTQAIERHFAQRNAPSLLRGV